MAGLTARLPLPARRAPFMGLAIVALFCGLWGGLELLGLSVPNAAETGETHGPLMALGFLGALISLERAVALDRGWAYAAPIAAAAGALVVALGAPDRLGIALLILAGAVLVLAYAAVDRLQRSLHNAVMLAGAVYWVAAACAWMAGVQTLHFAPLLVGFLVLTIVGERLELSRTAQRPRGAAAVLLAAIVVFCVGLALAPGLPAVGMRVAGVGLIAQAAWLARFDVARRTVRLRGVTRFMALALLAGYAWLAVAGVVWLSAAPSSFGSAYDAALHAVLLGFVMSMVFAHAPVIVPAVLRVPFPYHRVFYTHLALLHVSLLLRLLGGDAFGSQTAWQVGGVLNEIAVTLFLALTVGALLLARRRPGGLALGTPGAPSGAHTTGAPATMVGPGTLCKPRQEAGDVSLGR